MQRSAWLREKREQGLTDIFIIYPTAVGGTIEILIYCACPQQEEKMASMV